MSDPVKLVMKYDGIVGRSRLDAANSWMPLEKFELAGNWTNITAVGTKGPRKSGSMNMGLVTITRGIDVSTHGIFTAFTQRKQSKPAQIHVLSGDGGSQVLLSCTIENAYLLRWERMLTPNGGGGEYFTLGGDSIELKGVEYGPDEKSIVTSSPVSYNYKTMKSG